MFETIVFDLDETLYPPSSGLMDAMRGRIHHYAAQVTGLPPHEVADLCRRYLNQYGTTLSGLQVDYAVTTEHFLDYVHDLPVTELLRPVPQLNEMLLRLPQKKIIFTNGTREHALRVLNALGIAHHFNIILDIRAYDFQPKPATTAYQRLLQALPHPPQKAVFIDDRAVNLPPASQLGLMTVLIKEQGRPSAQAGIDHVIQNLLELEPLLFVR